MDLVIVESPTKAKTLARFLGKGFKVEASLGHIRDLPKSALGVDVERDFQPYYVVPPRSKKVVNRLKGEVRAAEKFFLATDPDREGEAIAWHICDVLGSSSKFKVQSSKRVVFHEITKDAVKEAFKHPRTIDVNLVDAQKARRVLDRLVGYKLSPLLWKKVRFGLSAGRVQSVAVRLIVEREREREKFAPQEFWRIRATLSPLSDPKAKFEAELRSRGGEDLFLTDKFRFFAGPYRTERTTIKTESQAKEIIKDLVGEEFIVESVKKVKVHRSPSPPFITATLQRAAAGVFGFSGKQTMRSAQRLYEQGLITYHRTDSTALARSAVSQIRSLIAKDYGQQYLPKSDRIYRTKSKAAQEAHEAIRPTDVKLKVKSQKLKVGRDEARLYKLIWERAVASQMAEAVFEATKVEIKAGDCILEASGSVLLFDGFLKVGFGGREDTLLPKLQAGDKLNLIKIEPSRHYTSPPPRYNEASLIKDLERFEIGRPSTYAPIISAIKERGYVRKEGELLAPCDVGMVVNDLLVAHFPEIVDIKFTAKMEEDLDRIANGQKKWTPVVREFYEPFEQKLLVKGQALDKTEITTLEETEEKCPKCGKNLVVKLGKYGKFLSCSGFPECKFAKPAEGEREEEKADKSQLEGGCPECGGELQLKEGKFGKFLACKGYPKCKFTKPYLEKIGMKCPDCGKGEVIVKRSRRGKTFFGCSRYPECRWASWKNPRRKAASA